MLNYNNKQPAARTYSLCPSNLQPSSLKHQSEMSPQPPVPRAVSTAPSEDHSGTANKTTPIVAGLRRISDDMSSLNVLICRQKRYEEASRPVVFDSFQ